MERSQIIINRGIILKPFQTTIGQRLSHDLRHLTVIKRYEASDILHFILQWDVLFQRIGGYAWEINLLIPAVCYRFSAGLVRLHVMTDHDGREGKTRPSHTIHRKPEPAQLESNMPLLGLAGSMLNYRNGWNCVHIIGCRLEQFHKNRIMVIDDIAIHSTGHYLLSRYVEFRYPTWIPH